MDICYASLVVIYYVTLRFAVLYYVILSYACMNFDARSCIFWTGYKSQRLCGGNYHILAFKLLSMLISLFPVKFFDFIAKCFSLSAYSSQ